MGSILLEYGMSDGRTVSCCFSLLKFYVGWPKGWAVFNMAKEIWTDDAAAPTDAKAAARF